MILSSGQHNIVDSIVRDIFSSLTPDFGFQGQWANPRFSYISLTGFFSSSKIGSGFLPGFINFSTYPAGNTVYSTVQFSRSHLLDLSDPGHTGTFLDIPDNSADLFVVQLAYNRNKIMSKSISGYYNYSVYDKSINICNLYTQVLKKIVCGK